MGWAPSLNQLTGPDSAALRQILTELRQFLDEPVFENGISLGDGQAVYNVTTGKKSQVSTELLKRPFVQRVLAATDASGYLTFSHGASELPRAVHVQAIAPSGTPVVWCATVDNVTATQARARFLRVNAGGTVGSHVSSLVDFTAMTIV